MSIRKLKVYGTSYEKTPKDEGEEELLMEMCIHAPEAFRLPSVETIKGIIQSAGGVVSAIHRCECLEVEHK